MRLIQAATPRGEDIISFWRALAGGPPIPMHNVEDLPMTDERGTPRP